MRELPSPAASGGGLRTDPRIVAYAAPPFPVAVRGRFVETTPEKGEYLTDIVIKPADQKLTHRVLFGPPLLQAGETVQRAQDWLVQPLGPLPSGVTVTSVVAGPSWSAGDIVGGVSGETYLVSVPVETSQQRVVSHSFVLRITNISTRN